MGRAGTEVAGDNGILMFGFTKMVSVYDFLKQSRRKTVLELGVKAKDKVTGFEGVVTGHCHYLYGCNQYSLVPPVDKDGKLGEAQWFDEGRVVVLGPGVSAAEVAGPDPGGPNRDAPSAR